jgi:hypothetical protein
LESLVGTVVVRMTETLPGAACGAYGLVEVNTPAANGGAISNCYDSAGNCSENCSRFVVHGPTEVVPLQAAGP